MKIRKLLPPKVMRNSSKGMTLIEILIVVALLGGLMAIIVTNLSDSAESARIDQTRIQFGTISQALQIYRLNVGRYPTTEQGLNALLEKPSNARRWRGPYTEEAKLRDPWGEEIQYELISGKKYKLTSLGPGGVLGDEDDITYPEDVQTESAESAQ